MYRLKLHVIPVKYNNNFCKSNKLEGCCLVFVFYLVWCRMKPATTLYSLLLGNRRKEYHDLFRFFDQVFTSCNDQTIKLLLAWRLYKVYLTIGIRVIELLQKKFINRDFSYCQCLYSVLHKNVKWYSFWKEKQSTQLTVSEAFLYVSLKFSVQDRIM